MKLRMLSLTIALFFGSISTLEAKRPKAQKKKQKFAKTGHANNRKEKAYLRAQLIKEYRESQKRKAKLREESRYTFVLAAGKAESTN